MELASLHILNSIYLQISRLYHLRSNRFKKIKNSLSISSKFVNRNVNPLMPGGNKKLTHT